MKKFIALTLTALAVLTMTSTPANAKVITVKASSPTIPGGIWCC